MHALITGAAPHTMTSREMADLTEKRHDNVMRTIETLAKGGVIALPRFEEVSNPGPGPATTGQYRVGKRDSFVIVAQLSPQFTARLVDRWQELEAAVADPLAHLPPEQRALVAVMIDNAAIKAKQAEQDHAIAQIETRVEEVAQTQLLTTRPAASESITHMRPRAAKMFGLPERVVEQVIRQSPIAPRPAGMVKNDRAEAEGSSYAVYWIKDVNDVIRRFVAECEMVTACMATHPYVEGRFKLARGAA